MEKVLAALIAIVAIVMLFSYNATATKKYFYNNGRHLNCGGYWMTYERSLTGEWMYCDKCGAEYHRK